MQAPTDPTALFARLGGEAGVRKLVDRFYDLMHEKPEAKGIRDLHPESLDGSRDKLYWFLVGWAGGPPMFVDRFGHPRLRARHLPFAIGEAERDQWMGCMRQALDEQGLDALTKQLMIDKLSSLADHMRNR
jgi:hemoglobin